MIHACLKCHSNDVYFQRHRTVCNDGFSLSIQYGENLYCNPRNNDGPWTLVEVGYIMDDNNKPHTPNIEWSDYADGDFPSDVYGYVPVEIVERFIALHGGRKFFV